MKSSLFSQAFHPSRVLESSLHDQSKTSFSGDSLSNSVGGVAFAGAADGGQLGADILPAIPPAQPDGIPSKGRFEPAAHRAVAAADPESRRGFGSRTAASWPCAAWVRLTSEGALFGALDKALQAQFRLSMIEGGPEPTPQQDLLAERSAQLKSRLDGSRDHSIGLSYWEEAQELLENPQSEAEDFKRVGVLLEEVLPLYFRLIQNP